MKLSTGKTLLYVNYEIIGIDDNLNLYEGYDGEIDESDLTKEEKLEIVNLMIRRWMEKRDQILSGHPQNSRNQHPGPYTDQ